MIKKQKIKFRLCGLCAELELTNEEECGSTLIDIDNEIPISIKIYNKINKQLFLQTLLHELYETCMILSGTQYTCTDKNNYKIFFQFEHDNFTKMTDEVAFVYEELKGKLKI